MLALVDSARLTHFIRGLPNSLKTFVANFQDEMQQIRVQNATVPGHSGGWGQMMRLATWSEFMQEIVNYECWMGWVR